VGDNVTGTYDKHDVGKGEDYRGECESVFSGVSFVIP
jgi:hypothetical protein